MKSLLFIIDMQNDFCQPTGSLYVPGAENDVERLCRFIGSNADSIDRIVLTQDNHHYLDISHPCFWTDHAGKHPAPFTVIMPEDVETDRWIPRMYPKRALQYLHALRDNDEYAHTVWPEHCIWGSEGAAIVAALMNVIADWAKQGKYHTVISKGTNPLTEHFGAFRANVPLPDCPETALNLPLINELKSFDRIWIAGEAKSHCVANTIRQLFDYPEIIKKLAILEDCMSHVPGFETLAAPIFEQAYNMGANATAIS